MMLPRVDDFGQQGLVRLLDVQEINAGGGHHDVTRGHVRHPDHALKHDPRLRLDQLAVLGLGQRFDQLVRGIGAGVDELNHALEQTAPVTRGLHTVFFVSPLGATLGGFGHGIGVVVETQQE